jgi:alpha-1,2-mannosyltransferase
MTAIVAVFRDAGWIDPNRAKAWAAMLGLIALVASVTLIVTTHAGVTADPWGRPLGTDFTSFWTAAKLALAGTPGSAWDPVAHAAVQRAYFRTDAGFAADYYAFYYPPPFLLICLPLGLLPYGVAVAVWVGVTGIAYFGVIRALLPRCWPAAFTVMSFPGLVLNAEHGQNGALSAALMGMAALELDRRPRLGGVCLGALCFKPQLALLVVPALILARRWRSLGWAAGTVAVLCVGSLLVLGQAAWFGFLAGAPLAAATLEDGLVGFQKMTSAFAAVRLLGGTPLAAWLVQAGVSVLALGVVAMVVRRRPGGAAEVAAMAAGACLATPFLLDYDLMLLAVPLAWVAATAERGGFWRWEKLVLSGGFLLPLVVRPLAMFAGVPLAPLVVFALLVVVVRRARVAGVSRVGAGLVGAGGRGGVTASGE